MADHLIPECERADRDPVAPPSHSGSAFGDADQVLGADSLETLAAAFGYLYNEQRRGCPDEDEPISGKIASEYSRVARSQPHRYSDFIQSLSSWCGRSYPSSEGPVILDVGSGVGLLTIEIARHFPEVRIHGIDVSPDMVSIAQEFRRVAEPTVRSRVRFHALSVYDLSLMLRDEKLPFVDVVLSRNMLHRLKRPSLGLQQMLDAVRPGGVLYVTAFCGDLDATSARDELVRNVRQRFQGPSGEFFWEFCRCYLSAVLRAPRRLSYEELFHGLLQHDRCADREITYRSYAVDAMILK